jgi:hypothetical protein
LELLAQEWPWPNGLSWGKKMAQGES